MRYYRLLTLIALPLLLLSFLAVRAGVVHADVVHTVGPNDSLWSISVQYDVPLEDIAEANGLEDIRVVRVGKQLVIPGVVDPNAPAAAAPDAPAPPYTVTVPADAVQTADGVIHPVQPGDTLSGIAVLYDVMPDAIVSANSISDPRIISIGQKLLIPGAMLSVAAATEPTPAEAIASAAAPAPAAAEATADLLPNSSFEGGWYFYLYNELQVPEGWKMTTDEGPNTLEGGSGGLFNRPEMRVVSKAQLPEFEWNDFVFDGFKTVKVFKGGAPTKFAMFTDQVLEPGRYRMTIRFFPDIVAVYAPGNGKTWTNLPLAAEARVIVNNGGTGWTNITPGQRGELSYEFTVGERGITRVGGEFRNRYEMANNGWFLDTWTLKRIGN